MIAPEGTSCARAFPRRSRRATSPSSGSRTSSCSALGQLLPDRAVAASHVSFPAFVFQAIDPRSGRLTLLADILGGGGGAVPDAPGDARGGQLHVELRAAPGGDRGDGVSVA